MPSSVPVSVHVAPAAEVGSPVIVRTGGGSDGRPDGLAADGLVTRKPYRGVFLTEEGRRVAAESKLRHQTVEAFLRSLGVSAETARIDAEGIEHHVSSETLAAFRRAMAETG